MPPVRPPHGVAAGSSTPVAAVTFRSALRHRRWAGLAFAVGAVLLATLLTWWGDRFLTRTIFLLFIAGMSATAWFAGRGPAWLAAALSVAVVDYLFLEPRFSLLLFHPADAAPLIGFTLIAVLVIWMSGVAHDRERTLGRQAAQLQDHATELEAQIMNAQSLQAELEESNESLADINARLARQRELLEEAQRSAAIGSWDWDIPVDRVSWSDEMYRLYGLEPRSVPVDFALFLRHVHPDDRVMAEEHVRRAMETHEPFQFEHRIVRADGAIRWMEARGKVQLRQGAPIRMTGSGQDITERRWHSESMRLLTEAYEALASTLDYEAALQTVARMCVRDLSDWCVIALGDETGRHENVVVAHRDPERTRWALEYSRMHPPRADAPTGVARVLRTGKPELYPQIDRDVIIAAGASTDEMRVIDELGLHSAIVAPMRARGHTIGAITFIAAESGRRYAQEDVWIAERLAGKAASAIDNARLYREAQSARAEAEAANRVKMDFLAAMSHELRTPLNAIAGYSQLLEMELHGALTPQQRGLVERLQRSQRHLLALVEQVLGFARLEAGRLTIRTQPVPVEPAVSAALEMLQPQMEARRLHHEWHDGDATMTVQADPDRLQQILVNLLANAVKFTPEDGRIRLDALQEGDAVEIRVSDTGAGIAPDQLERIFEPFVQLPQPHEKRSAGVGLGLSISRDLARAMNGDIRAESVPGSGSTFILRLPRATPRAG